MDRLAAMAAADDPGTERELHRLGPVVVPQRAARFGRIAAVWALARGKVPLARRLAPGDATVAAKAHDACAARLTYGAWRRAVALGLPDAAALRERLLDTPAALSRPLRLRLATDLFAAGRRTEALSLLDPARPEACRLARRWLAA